MTSHSDLPEILSPLRVVFMGTPDFAVAPLNALVESRHDIMAVYSQPPRPKGRGHKVQFSPVHQRAYDLSIPVNTPAKLKNDMDQVSELAAFAPDVCVVVAYGLILPKEILNIPRYGCLNIHASLLPRWRGAAPIQRAIWEGDERTGICIMQMEEGLDTGPVVCCEEIDITPQTTTPLLHDALSDMGARMIVEVLDRLAEDKKLDAKPQSESGKTYAHMLKKEHGKVDWNLSADQIDRQIRALNPWPGVWTTTDDGKRLKILKAEVAKGGDTSGVSAGTLCGKGFEVSCGDKNAVRLVTVQPENAKPMDVKAAINGGYLESGMVLGG